MRKNRISEAMQNINTKYIDEANEYMQSPKVVYHNSWMKWAAIAACFCITVAIIVAIPNLFHNSSDYDNKDNELLAVEQNDTIIVDFESNADVSYSTPNPGEYFCFIEVDEARKEYEGKNVSYLLAFDLFKAGGESITTEELKEEYQRLSDLGYKLYYVEDHWTYYGDNQKKYCPVVVGLFTDEELNNFKANEKYGYAFHFETNGDSSPIKIDEENVITDFDSSIAY